MSYLSNDTNILKEIENMHNPNLVNIKESPNGNIIYHVYSDGEITSQKGGFAYLKRSEFTEKSSIECKKKYVFPIKKDEYSYAIVTKNDAYKIRDRLVTDNS
jgi:hypothetical protein